MTRFAAPVILTVLYLALALSSSTHAQTSVPGADLTAAADAFRGEQYPQAVALFRKIVAADPNNAAAWHFLGQSLEKTNDLLGARQAWQHAIASDPGGKVADRTRPMLDKLPLPDAAKIVLPSGLTLFDWMSLNTKSDSASPMESLKESAGYVRDYGPFPQIVAMRDASLKTLQLSLDLTSVDSAGKALPVIHEMRALAGDLLDLIALSAHAEHLVGDYADAKSDYSKWLQLAPTDALHRKTMAENLVLAGRGEPPPAPPVQGPVMPVLVPDHFWDRILGSDLYRNAPKNRTVTLIYEVRLEAEKPGRNGQYTLLGPKDPAARVANEIQTYRIDINTLGAPGCFWREWQRSSSRPGSAGARTGSYFCGAGFITIGMDGGIPEVEGSIFPLHTGASMTITWRTSGGWVSTQKITIGDRRDASTLNPALTGNAWGLIRQAEIIVPGGTQVSGSGSSDSSDFFLENLGIPVSLLRANLPGIPAGDSLAVAATGTALHDHIGDKDVRQTISMTRFDIQ